MAQNDTGRALAIGLGVAVVAPLAVAALSGVGRPMARAALKSGIILYEKGREAAAEFSEVVEDLVHEARAELEQQSMAEQGMAAGEQATDVAEAGAENVREAVDALNPERP